MIKDCYCIIWEIHKLWDITLIKVQKALFKTLILNISKSAASNSLNFLVQKYLGHDQLLIKFLWRGHNGFKRYN